jgi:nucleoside-diphosphate kinase
MEQTLAILKPDCVEKGYIGRVIGEIEKAGFKIVALKMVRLSPTAAREFYSIHQSRFFFNELTAFMSAGPIVALVMEKENAIAAWRTMMGATDPTKAEPGTIRRELAEGVNHNLVHGSDSPENAAHEIGFFFSQKELLDLSC